MPQTLPIIIAEIAAAAASTGAGIYSSVSASNQASDMQKQQKQLATQAEQKQQQQDQLTKEQAFRRFAPDAQSQVGGSLTPESFSELVSSLSGYTGDVGLAQKTLYGDKPPTEPGLSTGGPSSGGLSDAIKRLFANESPSSNQMPSFAGGV